MEFIWAGNREEINQQRNFYVNLQGKADRIEICAVDNYQVFFDGQFISYGPERTAAGYSRKNVLYCKGVDLVEIKVISHGAPVYMCDFQKPFFGAEVYCGSKLFCTSKDFSCRVDLLRDSKVCRYSRQRGFVEKQYLAKEQFEELSTYFVESPIILEGIGDTADYKEIAFEKISEGDFNGFDKVSKPWWEDLQDYVTKEGWYSIEKDFLTLGKGYKETTFCLPILKTGFLKVDVESKGKSEFYIVFDEIFRDNKWIFRRSECNDLFVYGSEGGNYSHISAEPYTMKYIKVIYKGDVKIKPSIILYENSKSNFVSFKGDEKIMSILQSAQNTFAQNAVDIFTDCAGRERAGWLCDSYFTAKAERLFTGSNGIEKNFLENFILSKTDELPKGMLPMCFPSEHDQNSFIPNWAMWFVVELKDYLERTGDRELIEKAKSRVYGVIDYFLKFENSFGLLENLESWIFVEWSVANNLDYVKDINFPSNMLYSAMLKCAGELYGDERLIEKSEKIKRAIVKYSYNGKFFVDNAKVVDGKVIPYIDHISETCQYYALFFNIYGKDDFVNLIKDNFGPNRTEGFNYVGKSNAFIGNYLRLFWLLRVKEYDKVLNESIEFFYKMAKETGSLWEHDLPQASCNHGFASVIAVILLSALLGYITVEKGELVFDKDFDVKNFITVEKTK